MQHWQTDFNIDKKCNLATMFKSKEAKKAFNYFIDQNCFQNKSCKIDVSEPLFELDGNMYNLYHLLSDLCYERIFVDGITSPELIANIYCT